MTARGCAVCRWFHASCGCCILRTETMAPALLAPSRTLTVLLSASLVAACTTNEQKKTAPTTTTTAGATGAATPPATDPTAPVVPAGAPDKITLASGGTIHALTNDEKVLGHFVIANTSALLKDIKTQIAPPRAATMLEESSLRAIIGMGLGPRSNIAQALDLAAPIGCALVEVQPEPQVGCTFGYRGGAKAFVADLGEENKLQDAAGHVAGYSIDGKSVYVDELGPQIVLTNGADLFKQVSPYLERNLIVRAGAVYGDIEIVGYVATAFDRYRSQITPLLEQLSGTDATPPKTDNPALDGMLAAFSAYQKRSSKQSFDRIAEVSQLNVYLSVEPAGFMAGGAAFALPGSRMAQEAAQFGGQRLDPAAAGIAPTGTAMLAAFHANPRVFEQPSAVEMRRLLADAWAPLAGRDAAGIEAAIAAFQAEQAGLYDGQSLLALGNEPGAPVGLMIANHLAAGQSARDGWKAWSASFTPDSVLGKNFSQYMTWKFTPDAANIDGVAVDRWTIEPGAAVAQMASSMPADAKVMLDKVLGGMFLHIDRAEVGGYVVHTLAPKAEASYMKRVIAAVQGTGNVGATSGVAKVLARDPEAVGVLAVDIKQVLDLARNVVTNYANKPASRVPNYGLDLSDFFATFRYSTDGTSTVEFVFSQPMIDQLKPLMQ